MGGVQAGVRPTRFDRRGVGSVTSGEVLAIHGQKGLSVQSGSKPQTLRKSRRTSMEALDPVPKRTGGRSDVDWVRQDWENSPESSAGRVVSWGF